MVYKQPHWWRGVGGGAQSNECCLGKGSPNGEGIGADILCM